MAGYKIVQTLLPGLFRLEIDRTIGYKVVRTQCILFSLERLNGQIRTGSYPTWIFEMLQN